MNLTDMIQTPYLEFQRRHSIETDPGEFNEKRLYIGSNEMLNSYYPHMRDVKGISISILGGFDQVASLIAHSKTDLDILFDINPYAIEYGNIRIGLCLCKDATEYLQRLTSRKLGGRDLKRFGSAVKQKDYSMIQTILQGNDWDRDYMEETDAKITEYTGALSKNILARVADAVSVPEDRTWTGHERELTIYPFFDFFRENPSNWMFNHYNDFTGKVKEGRVKLIRGDIFGVTIPQLVRILRSANSTLGFFYDSNARSSTTPRSREARMFYQNIAEMPADEASRWISLTDVGESLNFKEHLEWLLRNFGE